MVSHVTFLVLWAVFATIAIGKPGGDPTRSPAQQPPNPLPTIRPTFVRTPKPTVLPTPSPTNPTAEPSAHPTTHPTARPTARPSAHPTTHPTAQPSHTPVPTNQGDTNSPTTAPTRIPTTTPTSTPTPSPTSTPTFTPTNPPFSRLATRSVWPKFRGDFYNNTGQAQSNVEITTPTAAFKFAGIQGGVQSSPAISVDGSFIFGGLDSYLYALSNTGSLKWRFFTGNTLVASPAITEAGDIVIATSPTSCTSSKACGKIYLLSATESSSGGSSSVKSLWTFDTLGKVRSSPAISPSGDIFIGDSSGMLYCLTSSGSKRWEFHAVQSEPNYFYLSSTPAFVNINATILAVVFGSLNGFVYALDTVDGTPLWATLTEGPVFASPAISPSGDIVIGSSDFIYCFSILGGSIKWKTWVGDTIQSSAAIDSAGNIYVGSDDNWVYALSPANGSILWSFETNGAVQSSPLLTADGSTLLVGSNDRNLYALQASDGERMWNFTAAGEIQSSPALAKDGLVVFGSTAGSGSGGGFFYGLISAPTSGPTLSPTLTPTTPTESPSPFPTPIPTPNPTVPPTPIPSQFPTFARDYSASNVTFGDFGDSVSREMSLPLVVFKNLGQSSYFLKVTSSATGWAEVNGAHASIVINGVTAQPISCEPSFVFTTCPSATMQLCAINFLVERPLSEFGGSIKVSTTIRNAIAAFPQCKFRNHDVFFNYTISGAHAFPTLSPTHAPTVAPSPTRLLVSERDSSQSIDTAITSTGALFYVIAVVAIVYALLALLLTQVKQSFHGIHALKLLPSTVTMSLIGAAFSSEMFLVRAMLRTPQCELLGYVALAGRLLHLPASTALLYRMFHRSRSAIREMSDKADDTEAVVGLGQLLHSDLILHNAKVIGVLGFFSLFDTTVLRYFPWLSSPFSRKADGYPNPLVFLVCVCTKLAQSGLMVSCQVAYFVMVGSFVLSDTPESKLSLGFLLINISSTVLLVVVNTFELCMKWGIIRDETLSTKPDEPLAASQHMSLPPPKRVSAFHSILSRLSIFGPHDTIPRSQTLAGSNPMHRSAEGLELTSMDSSGSLARKDTSTGVLMNTVAELQKQNARLELAVARMAASEDNLQTRLQQLEAQVSRIANSAM